MEGNEGGRERLFQKDNEQLGRRRADIIRSHLPLLGVPNYVVLKICGQIHGKASFTTKMKKSCAVECHDFINEKFKFVSFIKSQIQIERFTERFFVLVQ